jgi:hypothetical protein
MINYLATFAETRSSLVRCGTMLEDIYFVVFEESKIQRLGIFGSKKEKGGFKNIPENLGENPCGFCRQDGCFTSLLEKKSGNSIKISITSNCHYHYERMQYKHAATSSSTMPCTNVPIHCPLCPTSVSGNQQTIWKYNALQVTLGLYLLGLISSHMN